MNKANLALAEGLISTRYVRQADEARKKRDGLVTSLLSQRKIPREGWDDDQIRFLIRDLSLMDSNNFVDNVGVGEREGRVYSSIVREKYFSMAHGVGRSGDLTAEQPKAAGSSLQGKLTNLMAMHALKLAGLENVSACVVLPVATGMAIALSLLGIQAARPGPRKVIWPRVDQKTCLKSILALNLSPIIIENVQDGDEVVADLQEVERQLLSNGPEDILCIVCTASCFAPRRPDNVTKFAELAKKHDVPLLVNNAYGCQSRMNMKTLTAAGRRGRLDGIVQSTDKNFMVPVGGAILATTNSNDALLQRVTKLYPGRASCAAVQDLFITLLSMGENGLVALLKEREEMLTYFKQRMQAVAAQHGERLLRTDGNGVSLAVTLDTFVTRAKGRGGLSELGGMLFARACSGTRVVTCIKHETVGGLTFEGYGAHMDRYPTTYLSFACALGIKKTEVDTFAARLDKTLREFRKKNAAAQAALLAAPGGGGEGEEEKGMVVRGDGEEEDTPFNDQSLTDCKVSHGQVS